MRMLAGGINRLMARAYKQREEKTTTWPSGISHQLPRPRTDIGEIEWPRQESSALVILGSVIQNTDLDVCNWAH